MYRNQLTLENELLYMMPKVLLGAQEKLFHPQDWSIGMFEIGRPLGSGQ